MLTGDRRSQKNVKTKPEAEASRFENALHLTEGLPRITWLGDGIQYGRFKLLEIRTVQANSTSGAITKLTDSQGMSASFCIGPYGIQKKTSTNTTTQQSRIYF